MVAPSTSLQYREEHCCQNQSHIRQLTRYLLLSIYLNSSPIWQAMFTAIQLLIHFFPVHKSGLPVRRFGKKVSSALTGRNPRDCFPRFQPCFPYTMPSSHFLKTVFKFIVMPVDDVDYMIARDKVKTSQELRILSLSLFIQGSLWTLRALFSIVRNVISVSKVTSL